jgi:hypothetical protein
MARRREPVTGRTVADLVADIRSGLVEGYDCEGDAPRGKLAALKELGDLAKESRFEAEHRERRQRVWIDRAEAAEAELRQANAAIDDLLAEGDAAVRERDQARDALREIADAKWSLMHAAEEVARIKDFARAALDATAGKEPT